MPKVIYFLGILYIYARSRVGYYGCCTDVFALERPFPQIMYQSNRSLNIPPRAYPGHLTSFPAREGGNLITTNIVNIHIFFKQVQIILNSCKSSLTRANHPYKFMHIFANSNAYKYSFFPRVIPLWNSLPRDAVCAESIRCFRAKLNPM